MNCPRCGHTIDAHILDGCTAVDKFIGDPVSMHEICDCDMTPAAIEAHYWKAEALAARKLISEIGSRLEGGTVGETVNSEAMLDYLIARRATPLPELDAEEATSK